MDLSGGLLIVDDSSTSRMIIRRCIQMAGIEPGKVFEAENGLEAISLLKSEPGISCVCTDINMPKMDGKAFIRQVRGVPGGSALAIVVISSIADSAIEAELRELGVTAIIKKPVSPQKMKGALEGA